MVTACDYCSERSAVLYCRADSARLCLPCDKHVHSANALSGKHCRSQICDNCSAAPASVRCSTDNLLLCPDCDFDAHPLSSEHLRCPAPVPFSGCPSPLDLASAWGLDIVITTTQEDTKKKKKNEMKLNAFQCGGLIDHELMVPNCSRASSSCGKQGQVIVKQLLELLADGAEELRPRAPNGGGQWNGQEDLLLEQENEQEEIGVGEFTSLLMMQTAANVPKGEGDGNLLWNANTSTRDHSSQIWDFKLGQLRGHDESGSLELDFGGSDMEYLTKSYSELLKEASGTRRGGLDFPGVSCSFEHEEMIPFNGALNKQTASQGPATSESNNIAASFSGFNRPKSYGCSKDIQFTDESILIKSESGAAATTKADLELLAKNRGNAMQRYMEKKKNRRYDKQIRYESRKARADTRKRVKGRFVKASDTREG